MLADAPSPFATSSASAAIKDANGKEFKVGSLVRVAKEGLKAFQVPPKGLGYFDADKSFVAATSKYLVVPVGLRGLVTKVYDVDEVSANFPIQVKFEPGAYVDEGYDPPLQFLMHFTPEEVECT